MRGEFCAARKCTRAPTLTTEGTQFVATQVDRIAGAQAQSTAFQLPSFIDAAQRLLSFVIAHQQRRAEQRLRPFLARQSDATLADLGYTPAEIRTIRNPHLQ